MSGELVLKASIVVSTAPVGVAESRAEVATATANLQRVDIMVMMCMCFV